MNFTPKFKNKSKYLIKDKRINKIKITGQGTIIKHQSG